MLIDVLRGRPGAVDRLGDLRRRGDDAYVCAINVEEVARGIRGEEAEQTQSLLSGLREAPLGVREGWQAGEWRRDFAQRGRTLAQADCLVAAAALSIGARLATGNAKDFPMAAVTVEHWPVGT